MFQKAPRELKEPELDPGYVTLLQFRTREGDRTRLPPRNELLQGWRDFFRFKVKHGRSVNSTQAMCALHLFRHLLATNTEHGDLTLADLSIARDALLRKPRDGWKDHLSLSRELYEEISRQGVNGSRRGGRGVAKDIFADFTKYISALTQYGASLEAAEVLARTQNDRQYPNNNLVGLWIVVLRGLAREGNERELLRWARELERTGMEYSPEMHEVLTTFYAKKNKEREVTLWFQKPIARRQPATPETYWEVLKFCTRKDVQLPWLTEQLQDLCNSNPSKAMWDVIFQWAVLQGKGVEDIKHMIDVMVRNNESDETRMPDIATINCLVRAACEKSDPLLADRFITLASELELRPDETTYILQLGYRIGQNDSSGAYAAFDELIHITPHSDESLAVLNKYLRYLCSSKRPDLDRILEVTSRVEQQSVSLEPETVLAMCIMFLKNDQQYEVIDTLSLHTFAYSIEERAALRAAFVNYSLDRQNSTGRAWDSYSLLRQFFPETEQADRVKLMDSFFSRKRADMACYIFGHMRAHSRDDIRPTLDTYIRCLEGLGRCPDGENLKIIHNMLKMDTTVQPTTKLYNALMIAYLAAEDAGRALDIWQDITHSVEGPSYNSLSIIFRVCEVIPMGDQKANEIWEKIRRMDIEVPPSVYSAYCGAIAGQGHVEEVKGLIQAMEAETGSPVEFMT